MGWFDGWFGPEQYGPNPEPQAQAQPEYNFQDAYRRAREAQLYSGLMSTGGTLMAAGQPMHPNQRAQLMAAAAQNSGQMFDQRAPMQTAMLGMQANKMQQDYARQKAFEKMLMGAGQPQGGTIAPTAASGVPNLQSIYSGASDTGLPPGGAPQMPPTGGPGGMPAPLQILSRLPPEARMAILGLPPDKQAEALFGLAKSQMESDAWQPAEEGGLKGQRNRLSGKFEPFSPNAQPGTWTDIGNGMQQNTITGEKKPTDSTLAKVSVNPTIQMGDSLGKEVGAIVAGTQSGAMGAVDTMDTVHRIRSGMDKARLGPGATLRTDIDRIASVLEVGGATTDERLANTRSVVKGLAELSLNGRKALKGQGQVSDYEGKLLAKAASGDVDSLTVPELKTLLDVTERIATRQYAQHQTMLDKMRANPNLKDLAPFYEVPPLPSAPPPSAGGGWSIRPVQ